MQEIELFINILKDFILKKKTTEFSCNWRIIYELSVIHNVSGIIYYQCKEFLPLDYNKLFKENYCHEIFRNQNIISMVKSLKDELEKRNLSYFFVKGASINKYYTEPLLRTMGDIDLVIKQQDMKSIEGLILDLGFHAENITVSSWHYVKGEYLLELHSSLVSENSSNEQQKKYFFDAMNNCTNNELSTEAHLLFLIYHIRGHLINCGIGIRQFMDLAFFVREKQNELNWDSLFIALEEMEMLSFAKNCFLLCHFWFGIRFNWETQFYEIDNDFISCATQEVISNGVFGFSNMSNIKNITIKEVVHFGDETMSGINNNILKNIFPHYSELKKRPAYEFLEGKPYLTPIAWVYRLNRGLRKGGIKRIKNYYYRLNISENEIRKRKIYLNKWGIKL